MVMELLLALAPSPTMAGVGAWSGPGACGVTGGIFPQDAGPNKFACVPGGDAVGDDGGAPGDAGDTFGHCAVDRGLAGNHRTGQNALRTTGGNRRGSAARDWQ